MGKHKAKRQTSLDIEGNRSTNTNGLAHSTPTSTRNWSGVRHIFNRYEQLATRTGEGVKQGRGDARKSRAETTTSHKRSKSMTSMSHRNSSKRSSANTPTKSTSNKKEDTDRSYVRLPRSTSTDRTNCKPLLKPILKQQDSEGERQRVSRKVSVSSVEDHADEVWIRRSNLRSIRPETSVTGKQRSNLAPIINPAEVRTLAEKMAANRAAVVSNAGVPLPTISIDFSNNMHGNSDAVAPNHSVQAHQDAIRQASDMHSNYYTDRTNDGTWVTNHFTSNSEGQNPASGAHFLSANATSRNTESSSRGDYREIWIGRLPELPPVSGKPVIGKLESSIDIFSASTDFGQTNFTTWNPKEPSLDLIDLSVELPSTISSGKKRQPVGSGESSPLKTGILVDIEEDQTMMTTENGFTLPAKPKEGDKLISELVVKMSSRKKSEDLFINSNRKAAVATESGKEHPENTLGLSIDAGNNFPVEIVNLPSNVSSKLAKQYSFDAECESSGINLPKTDLESNRECSIKPLESSSFDCLAEDEEESKPSTTAAGTKSVADMSTTEDKSCVKYVQDSVVLPNTAPVPDVDSDQTDSSVCYEALVLPPPCTFGNEESKAAAMQHFVTNEPVLSVIPNDSANTDADMPDRDGMSNDLISISPEALELSGHQAVQGISNLQGNQESADTYLKTLGDHQSSSSSKSRSSKIETVSYQDKPSNSEEEILDNNDLPSHSSLRVDAAQSSALSTRPADDIAKSGDQLDGDSDSSKKSVTIATSAVIARRRHTVLASSKGILKNTSPNVERDTTSGASTPKFSSGDRSSLLTRSHSTDIIDDDVTSLRVNTNWSGISMQPKENSKIDYLDLPRLQLPKRPEKPNSNSLELVTEPILAKRDGRFDKTQTLPRGFTRPITNSSSSRDSSSSEKLSFPSKLGRMFTKKKKSSKATDSVAKMADEAVTVDSLYADWLDDSAQPRQSKKR